MFRGRVPAPAAGQHWRERSDEGRRHGDAELAQLADDPQIAPTPALSREPQDQLAHLGLEPSTPSLLIATSFAGERRSASGRLASDECQSQRDVLEAAVWVAELPEECFGCGLSGLLEWLADTGQPEQFGNFAVVEADQGKLVGDADPAGARGAQGGRGECVVVREDRRRRRGE
jgi:hypothetical protein